MTGNVSFNPFNGNPFTDIEIQYLDLNKDGKISQQEFNKGIQSWLSGGQDVDGEVNIGEEDKLFERVKTAGGKESATTQKEFKETMALVIDEYMEMYFTQNTNLSDTERTAIQNLIKTMGNTFIAEKLAENPAGPWDIKAITTEFINDMEQSILKNQKLIQDMNGALDGYKNAVDGNFDAIMTYIKEANANGNISTTEFNKIKNKAVQYLLGTLLKGEENTELLSSINPNYQKNSYYKAAMKAIKELESCSDPTKMSQLLNEAMTNLASFLNTSGTTKVVNAFSNYQESKEKEALTGRLTKTADLYLEQNIKASMSDTEKQQLKAFVDNCMNKFITQLMESGSYESLTDAQLQQQFKDFLVEQKTKLTSTQEVLTRSASNVDGKHNYLINVSDNANNNGNITEDEKSAIIKAATDLIISQMINDLETIPFLEGLNANYKNTAEYKEMQSLVTQLKSCVDPDELEKLKTQLNELITTMLNKYSGDELVKAVDSTKPIEINDKTKDTAIYNSSIGSDYAAGVSRGSDQGEEGMEQIYEMARQDMRAVADQLKAQLKAQLGTAYNEAEVEKWIQDAMNDTLAQFTENSISDNRHKQNTAYTDEFCFVWNDRTHSKRDKWIYNVKPLIDRFIENFNKVSKEKSAVQNDPTKATYDRENVIMNSIGEEYLGNKEVSKEGNDAEVKGVLLNEAKARLLQVSAALKSSLIAEGCTLSSAEIDEIIDQAIQNTLDLDKILYTDRYDHSVWNWKGDLYTEFNVKDVTNRFFDEFDRLYAEKIKDK